MKTKVYLHLMISIFLIQHKNDSVMDPDNRCTQMEDSIKEAASQSIPPGNMSSWLEDIFTQSSNTALRGVTIEVVGGPPLVTQN